MSQDPELGRPNYTAGSAASSSARAGRDAPGRAPRGRVEPRAVQAVVAAVIAWTSWTDWYHLPIVVAFVASIVAMGRGRRCESSWGRAAGMAGLVNLIFVASLLLFFGQRDGVRAVLDLLFT